ncbi:phosphoglycolate phosphatase [Limnochorda pilosa]|uniref:Phosphoglycolate phosphatase n=1 Tax=Limnochorda pilosa TaxID=1555112 RepID=A0A0K2SLI7_LIMPI|nr:phosphoglycolate phosphatase [Limnochorda pilosa]
MLDLDGTIIDTESALYDAWEEVYGRRGAVLPLEEWMRCVGTSPDAFDPYAYLEGLVGHRLDRRALEAEVEQAAAAHLARLRPRDGVVALVEAARREGLGLAVASSSGRPWVERFLEQAGLTAAIDVLATADDVARVKPAPDLYLLALGRLGVEASEALAVEDSPNGARAALAAGLRCVVVPNPLTAGEVFPAEVPRLSSLRGRTPRALWELARRRPQSLSSSSSSRSSSSNSSSSSSSS